MNVKKITIAAVAVVGMMLTMGSGCERAFVGTARVAQVCDQNNNPILAFASDHVTGYSTDVAKSTMFKLDDANNDGYVWVSRGSYTVLDTALLG